MEDALGFTGGAWLSEETGIGNAYIFLGAADETEDSEEEEVFIESECVILRTF